MLEDDNSMASQTSDEELDWEEVEVPDGAHEHEEIELHLEEPSSTPANIEITLQTRPKKDDSKKKAAGISHAERLVRIGSHKIHTVCLLANARVRNAWLNDELLHARLLSLTPLAIQNGFAMIHKSRVPDQNKRGRLFEAAVTRLVEWWTGSFFTVLPIGHIRNRTFDDVQKELSAHSFDDMAEYPAEEGEEVVRSANSLMKHALMQSGSRDTSAQLFTALCRALDIPARLVVSLQSVPWQTGIGKSKSKAATKGVKGLGKGKGKLVDISEGAEESDEERIEDTGTNSKADIKGKGKERAHDELPPVDNAGGSRIPARIQGGANTNPAVRLRKTKAGNKSQGILSSSSRSQTPVDPLSTPPVFWTEVFSRADSRWLPIDPIRAIVNKRQVFDPSPSAASGPSRSAILQENRMLYVIALEEDGYGRDVTARYARDYTAKVAKIQGVGAGGGGRTRKEWWERVLQTVTRPYRLQRDDFEDDELHNHQLTEGMPTTMAGFKDHPLYALSRHLKRSEVIDPPTELGKFRGEPVYPRSSVIALKTAENWMRQGRKVREGCQPMKMVTQRAVTIGRKREVEVALERARADEHGAEGAEEVLQGLYARAQTELYRPEPIVDGKIPKNDFGSIDLYVPSMLPEGGVHIPFKGVAKVAKKLGFDYAEAVTGFEFKKRKAFPVVEGIVVAAENETVIVEAYLEAEQEAEEKARVKRLDQVQKRWIRLVQGLRIRERLQKQYAPNSEGDQQPHWLDTQIADGGDEEQPGGFLTTADDVVEAFHLPKDLHPAPSSSFTPPIAPNDLSGGTGKVRRDHTSVTAVGISTDEPLSTTLPNEDIEMGDIVAEVQTPRMNGLPRSMREFAEAAARQESEAAVAHPSGEKGDLAAPGSSTKSAVKASARRAGAAKGHADTPLTRALSNRKTARKRPRGNSGNVSSDPDNHTTPAKRGRRPSAPASSSTPARVLRPRPQKSAAKVQEEADMERAYRQAIKD